MRKIFYFTLLLIIMVTGIAFYLFRRDIFNPLHSDTLTVNNIERKFYYHVPRNISSHPKLIFVLHGSNMEPVEMQLVTGFQFNKLADESRDVIVVYPQGYKLYWNDCRRAGTYETKLKKMDDPAFFRQMIDFFSSKYNIDRGHIFATGYSNGGHMVFKLAKEEPDLFKGFAAICANLPVETNDDCIDKHQPVSMLIMNGTTDPINPYTGGEIILGDGLKRGAVVATEQTMRYWTSLSTCDTSRRTEYDFPDIDKSDNSTAVEYDYKCPATGKEVALVKIINGGHVIPNPGFRLWPMKKIGNVNKDINAPEIIFNYFMGLK